VWELLGNKGEGFRIVDGKLLVGDYAVNDNFEVPDKVQKIFGGVATIFMGDERVATNVLDSGGNRAVGTKLVGPAFDAVFREGRPYRGEAMILGVSYLTAYDPIRNSNGEIIGALFVGLKKSVFLAGLNGLKIRLIMTLAGMVAVFSVFMVLLGREARKFERRNNEQFRFLQTLIDTIPSPVYFKDKDGFYLGCNKAFESGVGTSKTELVGKTAYDIWPCEYADLYTEKDRSLIENPGSQTYEAKIGFADNTLHDVIFEKATFTGNSGETAGLVGIIQDITDRKAAESAMENAFQQLHDIVEFLPDATFVVDRDKRVIAWNRAIEKMTGMKKEEVIGKGDYIYSLPFYGERRPILIDLIDEDVERVKKEYAFITSEGRTLFAETYIPVLHGKPCYLWGTATPLFDSLGNQVGAIESIRNITQYKQSEEEKTRLEMQLAQARMLETLVARLGHDLKTPLTPLFILLPLIKKRLSDADLVHKVEMCIKSATTIKNLADKTRVLCTFPSMTAQNEQQNISLASCVTHAVSACSAMITRKQIDCRNMVAPSLIVSVVPDQFHELFVNLISNAVQFTGDHGSIRISSESRDGTVLVSVQDNGVGLDSAHLELVFEAFFKVDESRHDLKSSGLGLSICKRIIDNHRGKIWAESPGLGEGTTVKFTINE